MELKWIKKGENSIVVVMPTANTEQDFTQRAIKTFREMDYDILCVQDSGSEFSFAKSMNEGINEVLKNPEYLLIGLSKGYPFFQKPIHQIVIFYPILQVFIESIFLEYTSIKECRWLNTSHFNKRGDRDYEFLMLDMGFDIFQLSHCVEWCFLKNCHIEKIMQSA